MSNCIKPENLPEKLIWYYILFTYPIYFLGGQFVFAPLLAIYLTGYLVKKWWNQNEHTPAAEKITISPTTWAWVVAILVIELALIVGHLNFNLGISEIIIASVLWFRHGGVFVLFIIIGHLNIRPKLIYRAACILCLQSFLITFIGIVARMAGIPNLAYISPLQVFGSGPKPYEVVIFQSLLQERIFLFAIWPTILASLCNIYFCCALGESNKKLRWLTMFSSIFILAGTQGRTAIVGLPFVLIFVWFLTNFIRPWVQFASGFISLLVGLYGQNVINSIKDLRATFDNARADSSKTRKIIYEMSLDAWWNEARIWGHGIRANKGPEIIGNIALGTHHTWFGILYSYGLVGFVALAIIFLWSFIDLLIKSQTSETAKMGLRILLIIFMTSLADNVEMYSYVYIPALIILGCGFKESLIDSVNKYGVDNNTINYYLPNIRN